jgi:hypothetical protein
MKKLTLLAAVALFAAFSFSSCKKCVTCTYNSGSTFQSETEYCGKKADRESYESACKLAGGTAKTK